MPDYDGGSVFLQVVPSFRNVQRLIGAEAKRWGNEAGRTSGEAYEREFGRVLRGSDPSVGPSRQSSTRQGAESGGSFADGFRKRVEAAMKALPPVRIGAATTEAEQKLRDLRLDLERLSEQTVGVDIDSGVALMELDRIRLQLERLGGDSASVQVRADVASALAQIATVQAAASALDGQRIEVQVDADTSSATASLNTFTGRLVLLGAAGAALAPAIVPAAAAAAVALAGIGSGALVGLAGIGTLVVGFAGVGDAVKAMGEAQSSAAEDAAAAARRQSSSAAAIASAQRGLVGAEVALGNAREDAAAAAGRAAQRVARAQQAVARAQEDAARRVREAQSGVAEAQERLARAQEQASERTERAVRQVAEARERAAEVAERAAEQVADALARQERAEQSVRDAQADALDVQRALTQARADAQRQIEDLALDVEQGALRERDAVLGVEEAQRRLAEVMADPEADDLARRRAQLSYDQSVQQLEELRVRNARLAQERAQAVQQGVDGSDRVRAAQERVAEAQERVTDAERGAAQAARDVTSARADAAEALADAQQVVTDALAEQSRVQRDAARAVASAQDDVRAAVAGVAQAQAEGARRVADAQQAVGDAAAAAAEQQRQSAQSIAAAQRSVVDAQAGLAQALQQTGDTGSASMRKLEESLDALSPAGAAFAAFLFGLKPAWEQVQSVVQQGLLPGVQAGIEALLPVLPAVTGFVGSLAAAMGDLAHRAGEALAGPAWRPFFDYLTTSGAPILVELAEAAGGIALGFANLMVAFAPLSEAFIRGLGGMADAFADWSAGLSDSNGFQAFLDYVRDTMPAVLDFLGSLFDALGNIIRSMAPFGPVTLIAATALADLIAAVPPALLSAIVLAFIGFNAVMLVLGPIVTAVSAGMAVLAGGGTVLAAVAAALGGPVTVVALLIAALGAALVIAYQQSETFRDVVQAVWVAVRGAVVTAWEQGVQPALRAFGGFITDTLMPLLERLWTGVVRPVFEGIGTIIRFTWDRVIQPVLELWWSYVTNVVGPAILWLWQNVTVRAFENIRRVIETAWSFILPIMRLWHDVVRFVVGAVITWLWKEVVEPAWKGISSAISDGWAKVKPILQAFGVFIETVVAPAFDRGATAIGTAWDKIRAMAAKPINFVIETVYTNGIKKLFDRIADAVGSDARLPPMKPLTYATGGIFPGYTPGRDIGYIGVSGGEAIMRPEWTRAIGSARVHEMNAVARTGGVAGVRRYLGGFDGGGVVGAVKSGANWVKEGVQSAAGAVTDFVVGNLRRLAEAAFRPIRASLDGIGGGLLGGYVKTLGNRAIDSVLGFAGRKDEEAGQLEGGSFTRYSRGWPPPRRGVESPNAIAAANLIRSMFGVTNIGILGQRGNKSDHPFGKAVDAMIGNYKTAAGIALGNRIANYFVANPQEFGTKYVIWRDQSNSGSGWRPYLHPSGVYDDTTQHRDHPHISLYDDGGKLPVGLSAVLNATGGPEYILNQPQWDAVFAAVRQVQARGGDMPAVDVSAVVAGLERVERVIERLPAEYRMADRKAHGGRGHG